MKKFICIILLVCSFFGLHAELNPPHRYFEIGADVDVAVANNWFSIPDFFKETLVVDFTKMSESLNNGLSLNFDMNANVVLNLNIGSIFRFGVFGGLGGTGSFNLSQGVIDFIAKGNSSGDHKIDVGAGVDSLVYAEAGLSFQTFIKKWGISLSPAVYLPVIYIPNTEVSASITPMVDNGTLLKANVGVDVYSVIGIDQFDSAVDINKLLNLKNVGMDISLGVEYPLFSFLDLGLSVENIPIIPGKLEYKTAISASYEYNTNKLFDSLSKDDEKTDTKEDSSSKSNVEVPKESVHLSDPETIFRPTIIGLAASYRPFGDWFNVRGGVDFVIQNPFYVNFNVGAGFHLLKMSKMGGHLFNITLDTGYSQRMWTQQLGLVLNFRAFELNLSVSSRSGSFVKSFMGAGLGLGVGFRLGW